MSNVIKFDINTNIFYNDLEYCVKAYTNFDEVLLKRTIEPFNEKIVKVSELIKESKNIKKLDKDLVEIKNDDFEEALKRYKTIESLLNLKNRTTKDVQAIAKKHKKGIATIYRWLSLYEEYGTITSLASKREYCGAKGKSRLDESVNTIIQNVIEYMYLNKQRYTLLSIYNKIV